MQNSLIINYKNAIESINKNYNRIRKDKKALNIIGIDWLLDNFYIISQTNAVLKKDIKSVDFEGMPLNAHKVPLLFNQIYDVAVSEKEINQEILINRLKNAKREYLNKEIHSIPLFINIAIIIKIARVLEDVYDKDFEKNIGNLFSKLRQSDTYDIKEIFKSLSKTEKILEEDKIYAQMDYKSKSYYRYIIDKLAKKYKMTENEVVEKASSLSKEQTEKPKDHVGYFLLEKPLGKEKSQNTKRLYILSVSFLSFILFCLLSFIVIRISRLAYCISALPLIIICMEIGINTANYFFSRYIRPKKLVGLKYERTIPESSKTLITIAALTPDKNSVSEAFKKLENYYLGNKNENIYFSLLSDKKDSETENHPDDDEIIAEIENNVACLNKKYNTDCFLGFHRKRTFSESQGKFIGWERKRGGLQNLVEFLRGDENDTFSFIGKNISRENIKYIITLDSDTHIPIDAAKKLIGIADHPLNEFRHKNGQAMGGYGILQPRIAICVKSASKSKFSKYFAGISGFDHYCENISDIYHDIWGEATFTGKGLLVVDAFYHVLKKYIPENKILSHDLLEGSIVRAGMVSDIEFSDGFPSKVVSYFSRMHRWIRGDWQLIPYLGGRVSDSNNSIVENPLKKLAKWKIADNLRRSLLPVALIIITVMAVYSRNYDYVIFMLLILVSLSFPVIAGVFDKCFYGDYKYMADRSRVKLYYGLKAGVIQGLLLFAFLPYNAYVSADAVIRAIYRGFVSRKNILEWTTAEEGDRKVENKTAAYYRKMKANIIAGLLLMIIPFNNLITGAVFCAVFIIAPYVAKIISDITERNVKISGDDKAYLRLKAYSIWRFFDRFVTAKDNFLPPDNYQKNPFGGVARRTSPTNIGLYLTSVLTARDFGYITTPDMLDRLENTLSVIKRLDKYKGHLYNWYNTLNLDVLKPEFISTVDSGNFVACLIALREGIFEYADREIADGGVIHALFDIAAYDRVKFNFSRYLSINNNNNKLRKKEIIDLCDEILGENFKNAPNLINYCQLIKSTLINYQRQDINARIESVSADLTELIDQTGFDFLYDRKKELFSIGYNRAENSLIKSYYDLIASEARQASYIAIARGEVPKKHWNAMSKNMTKESRYKGLVSWTGTAFEYLMPLLFLPNYDMSLWDETYKFVVYGQISYAKKHNTPYGISESGFYSFDNELNYQYQAFGVPSHGLKRGLENDLVISPYSTFLTLPIDYRKAVSNLKRLEKIGAYSKYGFYEAIDYTKSRAKNKKGYNIVESYMSHHQGMSFLAVSNCVNGNILSKRFMRNEITRAAEELLLEKIPVNVKIIKQRREKAQVMRPIDRLDSQYTKRISDYASYPPECTVISDGISSIFLTDRGQNYIKYGKIHVTRFREDYFSQYCGTVFYIFDAEKNILFTPTVLPLGHPDFSYKTKFSDTSAQYYCENDDALITLTANLVYENNTVLWTISIKNKLNVSKKYKIYCYNEIILSDIKNDIAHRAFNNMFLRVSEAENGIIIKRAKREERDREYYYSLYIPISDMKGKLEKFCNRQDIMKNNSYILSVDPRKSENGVYSNTEPAAVLCVEREIKKKSSQSARFFTSFSKDKEEMLATKDMFSNEPEQKLENILKNNSLVENYKITPNEKGLFFEILAVLTYGQFTKKDSFGKYPDITSVWQIGISADYPIMTIKLKKDFEPEVISLVMKCFGFLSRKNIRFDLVILTEDEDMYQTPVYKAIKKTVEKSNFKDGVFVFSLLTLDENLEVLLKQVSSFYAAPKAAKDLISEVKRSKKAGERARLKAMPYASNKDYRCYYNNRDFVISLKENANLSAVYSNVIANKKMGFLTTQNGGGYTYFKNSREFKITNWINDPVSDVPTEILYLLDKKDRAVFSLTPYPTPSGEYDIINSQGSASYIRKGDIETDLKLFLAEDAPVKFYRVSVKNNTSSQKNLKLYYYTRPVLDVAPKNTNKFNCAKNDNIITVESAYFKKNFAGTQIKITATNKIESYTFNNLEFLGGGSFAYPDGFNKDKFSEADGQYNNACILITFDIEIEPNGVSDFSVIMAADETDERLIGYADNAVIKAEEQKTRDCYDRFLSSLQINTPDEHLNNLVNSFLPYQTYICRLIARTGYYQCGGAFGFRDQLQDGVGLLHFDPEILKGQIINASKRQFEEGDVLHWWHIFDSETEINGIRTRFRDDSLWLIYSVYEYIRISNDFSILDTPLPYLTGDKLRDGENEKYTTFYTGDKEEPLWTHLERAMNYSISLSRDGLAHFGGGDWNDGMNRVGEKGTGTSVWLSWFLYDNLRKLSELFEYKGIKNNYDETAALLKENINKNAWDGGWYIRGIYDNGDKLGSSSCNECSIDLIAQAWARISNAGEPGKINTALNSVYERLFDKQAGILKLLDPPFDKTANEPGYIKSYIPGVRENGGQYTHAAIWGAMAFLLNGDNDRGYEILNALNPAKFVCDKKDLERYKVEPYVISADIYSAEKLRGRGGWSWYTGAAGWYYKVVSEVLLGINIKNDILSINPALPSGWDNFDIKYKIKNKTFNIKYKKGTEKKLILNGKTETSVNISTAPENNILEVIYAV